MNGRGDDIFDEMKRIELPGMKEEDEEKEKEKGCGGP